MAREAQEAGDGGSLNAFDLSYEHLKRSCHFVDAVKGCRSFTIAQQELQHLQLTHSRSKACLSWQQSLSYRIACREQSAFDLKKGQATQSKSCKRAPDLQSRLGIKSCLQDAVLCNLTPHKVIERE